MLFVIKFFHEHKQLRKEEKLKAKEERKDTFECRVPKNSKER